MTSPCLASIPVLDWKGPKFLLFYVTAYLAALAWTLYNRRHRFDAFHVPGPPAEVSDPYEAAYLAGGAPRCVQVAVASLVGCGALRWVKAGWFGQGRLVVAQRPGAFASHVERALFDGAERKGSRGLTLQEAQSVVSPQLGRVEAGLAGKGLRPTASELSGKTFRTVLPLVGLLLLGVLKLFIGFSLGKPVGFLLIGLVVTLVTVVVMGIGMNDRLTPAGRTRLHQLRLDEGRSRPDDSLDTLPMAVAVIGITHLTGYPTVFDSGLRQELAGLGAAHGGASGGGGCSTGSSGCGGSGCGGGGCGGGGCGGCGGGD